MLSWQLLQARNEYSVIDEKPEVDEGYITLVNAFEDKDGSLTECDHYTGIWAWKQPNQDGTVKYTKVQGNVEFKNITFGYEDEKRCCIYTYAKPGQKIAFVGSTGAEKQQSLI